MRYTLKRLVMELVSNVGNEREKWKWNWVDVRNESEIVAILTNEGHHKVFFRTHTCFFLIKPGGNQSILRTVIFGVERDKWFLLCRVTLVHVFFKRCPPSVEGTRFLLLFHPYATCVDVRDQTVLFCYWDLVVVSSGTKLGVVVAIVSSPLHHTHPYYTSTAFPPSILAYLCQCRHVDFVSIDRLMCNC